MLFCFLERNKTTAGSEASQERGKRQISEGDYVRKPPVFTLRSKYVQSEHYVDAWMVKQLDVFGED